MRTRQLRAVFKPKPVVWILVLWSVWSTAKKLRNHSGPFGNFVLACAALILVILYTVPNKSVQLFPKRVLAFLMDLALLAILTVGTVHPLYELDAVEPSAIVSMGIVWAWFLAFVLADWKLGGTPGQLALGFRLKNLDKANPRLRLITCLTRNLLTILVPVVIAGRLQLIPLHYTRLEKILRLGTGYAVLAVIPLSIAFTGGHTLPDLLLRVAVLPKRSGPTQYPSCLDKKRWVLLTLASLATGLIFGLAQNLESELAWNQSAPPLTNVAMNDPGASAWLWPRLQQGIPMPEVFVQHVEVYHVTGSLTPDTYGALDSTLCSGARKAPGKDFLAEAQVRILTPSTVKGLLYANLENAADSQAPPNKRPTFLLFNLTTREDFGSFTITQSENSALCLAEVNGKPSDKFVLTGDSDWVGGSVIGLSLLAVGDLRTYSYALRLPIWNHHE